MTPSPSPPPPTSAPSSATTPSPPPAAPGTPPTTADTASSSDAETSSTPTASPSAPARSAPSESTSHKQRNPPHIATPPASSCPIQVTRFPWTPITPRTYITPFTSALVPTSNGAAMTELSHPPAPQSPDRDPPHPSATFDLLEQFRDVAGRVKIGPYRVLDRLGEGGMGVVYLAEEREPVRRTVALKIIRSGMGSPETLARFDAERQALAMLSHPSIARVFHAGVTDTGLPYFAMEYVRGLPLTK